MAPLPLLNRMAAGATILLTIGLTEARLIGTQSSGGPGPNSKKSGVAGKANERLNKFQVAAGSVMQVRLRTPVDSSTARVDDQVDAVLTGPITQEGTELIPSGSTLLGKILNVTAASVRQPLGKVEVGFYIVEHAGTGSRAAIETHTVLFHALPAEDPAQGRRNKARPVDVRSSPDQPLTVRLAEPLIVYIPR
jgi:hypothetical protein